MAQKDLDKVNYTCNIFNFILKEFITMSIDYDLISSRE